MPLLLDTTPAHTAAVQLRSHNCIEIGLVNNMPDAALEATERQFVELIQAATNDIIVRLRLYALPDVRRGDRGLQKTAARYRDVAELWDSRLDGLVVTGTEPRTADLRDEPYWPTLGKLVDWARDNTASAIWSCLAAHAAVLHTDGIERLPLAQKQFGVFDCGVVKAHPLTKGAGTQLRVPHSRHNFARGGARVLGLSPPHPVGVRGGRRVYPGGETFPVRIFQGHPEYEGDTLLREYRRDIGRFLRGEREHYPAAPQNYFNDAAAAAAEAFCARALHDCRESLIAGFPMRTLEAGCDGAWHRPAVRIYENWLRHLSVRIADRRKVVAARPRSRHRGWLNGAARSAADRSSAR